MEAWVDSTLHMPVKDLPCEPSLTSDCQLLILLCLLSQLLLLSQIMAVVSIIAAVSIIAVVSIMAVVSIIAVGHVFETSCCICPRTLVLPSWGQQMLHDFMSLPVLLCDSID